MNKIQQIILTEIHQAKTITIFRHINPDHDALGSQHGLKHYLTQRYPNKQVYACGFHRIVKGINYPPSDDLDDEVIKNSLAIVLDSANTGRIDDQRYHLAQKIIKIDHHPNLDDYGDVQWVDASYASTAEMITEILQFMHKKPLDHKVATYLLAGILSDTIMFSIANTSARTLAKASYLLESGVNINELHQSLYSVNLNDFKFINFVQRKAKLYHKQILVAVINDRELKKHNIHPNLAKEYVYALANIEEVEVWGIFIEYIDAETSTYNGSLRSKKVAINGLAAQYNGGGHPLASAVKDVDEPTIKQLVDKIAVLIKENHHVQT